ncbi:hypothetical protein BASA81_000492 [Batrachochytrium salamandrivorans]|nr:hypothetical protein BASA81_000492 [Batrachochytrium salamandrivorans]
MRSVVAVRRALSSSGTALPPPKVKRGSPIGWPSLLVSIGVGGLTIGYFYREKEAARERVLAGQTKSIGKPLLGGPFTLVNSEGRVVQSSSLFPPGGSQYGLLYFGFCQCPDICPQEMHKLSRIVETMDKDPKTKDKLLPIFITVDPRRDGAAQVGHYVKDFHPKTIGLTGTPNQIADVCKSFRVYHVPQKEADNEEEKDYLVDHSIVIYLLGPDGSFLDFFTQMTEEQEAVQRIQQKMLAEAEK